MDEKKRGGRFLHFVNGTFDNEAAHSDAFKRFCEKSCIENDESSRFMTRSAFNKIHIVTRQRFHLSESIVLRKLNELCIRNARYRAILLKRRTI